ncbi:cyanophycinase [Hymenobacter busanensis]|uniref:Cyanophycinase n=1 Tax=Hymenobacter busanensis TaxID=2607656 RepID=A0A7L5A4B6_9BACT|nr:cyanophycinase [Hymenobacter busanensis]KAA9338601.1 cyanophycinase [Hymenobacter busanensis]QHJ08970.1 cyanophycinase [Hymenobacter busanensis]
MPTRKKTAAPRTASTNCPHPKGILIAIGGHEQKEGQPDSDEMAADSILQRFVDELTGEGPVVIIPAAAEKPEEAADDYVKTFTDLGVKHVEVLDVRSRDEANNPDAIRLLDSAAGVMFTGGDQLRLTALLGGTDMLRCMKERYANHRFVIAGTSAGAAAMSTPMIYQGRNDAGFLKDEIHVTTGLQFMHDVAVDTHFVARGRIVRMAQIIATNPGCIGLGLEEDTGVVVTNGCELEVIGNGMVVIVDGRECDGNTIYDIKPGEVFSIRDLRIHLLARGQRYSIPVLEQMYV